MGSLALYIDKWYIIGAVIGADGIPRPLQLPNREDRIWLFFYEDVANNEISYSKEFQRNFRNNDNHFYGDVFSKITKSSAKYIMFKRPQPLKQIFKSSKIFEDLRKNMMEEGDIATYVSFSKDISSASRFLFLEELKNEKFDVKESVARIGHLALEYASRKEKNAYNENGYYLVLNACNENLHFSLYNKSYDLFNREAEDIIVGMGTDIRSRALIEHVVDSINERECFLKTAEERENEYLRMSQYVDDWLIKLAASKSYVPTQLNNITFSHDQYKKYCVSVRKSKIDERTNKIVEDIINVVQRFVRNANVSHEQIKGILFLGNTFTNGQFKKEFLKYYNLDNSSMVCYKDYELASIVSAYTLIDLAQFSVTRNAMRADAKAELQRIKIAEEEAIAQKRAQEEAEAIALVEREANEAERHFKEAMDKGYDAEREHNYDDMAEYFKIAITIYADNEEAKTKYEEALRKKAEITVQQNQYKEKIQQAKAAYDEGDYEKAKSKAEEARSYNESSAEAKKIYDNAVRRINSQKDFERYIDRADLFISKKAYNEALQELSRAQLLNTDDANNSKEIASRKSKIEKELQENNQKVTKLTDQMDIALNNERFDEALQLCRELAEIDFTNTPKWSGYIAEISIRKERATKERKLWDNLIKKIDEAQWNENWEQVVLLCKEALAINNDEAIENKLLKAEDKLKIEARTQQINQSIAEIKDLILKSKISLAKERLAPLRKEKLDPSQDAQIKELNKLIFYKEDETKKTNDNNPNSGRVVITGFSGNSEKPLENDFNWDFPPNKEIKPSTVTPQKKETNKNNFFDSASSNASKAKGTKPTSILTNDDFNF